MIKRNLQIFFLYLLVGGLFVFPTLHAKQAHVQDEKLPISGTPVRIKIPSLNIDLSVIEGGYDNKTWTSATHSALFAIMTERPNDTQGNTLIYGHNTAAVFGSTSKLAPGDLAYVETSEGRTFIYSYTADDIVLPSDVSIFEYQGSPRLTLLTCKGFTNDKRRLMYFDFVSVQP